MDNDWLFVFSIIEYFVCGLATAKLAGIRGWNMDGGGYLAAFIFWPFVLPAALSQRD